jgi:hypothetical protein
MRLLRQAGAPAAGITLGLFVAGAVASAQPETTAAATIEACRAQPAAQLGARGLSRCFYEAAVRVSRAAGHNVAFETGKDAEAETAPLLAEAAEVTSEALTYIAAQPGGKSDLARIGSVVITQSLAPSAGLSNGVLTITIDPTRRVAGRPSARQIERAARADAATPGPAAVTCITTSQVVEGITAEACAAALKADLDALHGKGLAAAAPLLVVRANGQILRGTTTVTLAGGHGLASATDGALTCRGDYDGGAPWPTTDILFRCSDGRTGVAKRTSSFLNQGEGTVLMSDGEVSRFAFGCSTRVDDLRTCPVVHAGQSASAVRPPAQPRQPVCLLGMPRCP